MQHVRHRYLGVGAADARVDMDDLVVATVIFSSVSSWPCIRAAGVRPAAPSSRETTRSTEPPQRSLTVSAAAFPPICPAT